MLKTSFIVLIFIYSVSFVPAAFSQSFTITLEAEGLSSEQKTALLNNITLYRQRTSALMSEDYIRRLYQMGSQEILNNAKVFGYYKAKIESSLDDTQQPWIIRYQLQPGPALPVSSVDIQIQGEAIKDNKIKQWREDFPLSTGDNLNQTLYDSAKQELQNILRERGYFSAVFQKSEIRISLKKYISDIVIYLDSGPRYRFGPVSFKQDTFSDKFLSRFVGFTEDDYFDYEKLIALQRNLSKAKEFKQIEISPLVEQASDNKVPVDVVLTLHKPWSYTLGLGYGTDTGARFRAGVQRRQITSTGQNADAEIYVSQVRSTFSSHYRIPLKNPATDNFIMSLSRNVEDIDNSYSETNTLGLSKVQLIKIWERTYSLSYLNEVFEVSNVIEQSRLLIPALTFVYKPEQPLVINPEPLNWRFNVTFKGADEGFLSDVSYFQTRMFLGNYTRLLPKLALVSRLDVGWSWVGDFQFLPVSQRFYAGGDWSIRGYDYNSLGPEDDSGEVIGGERLLVGSMELQYKFAPKWDVAAFYDTGDAYDKNQFQAEAGAGAGIGWQLPFGVIRAYMANALTDPDRPWRFHLLVSAEW